MLRRSTTPRESAGQHAEATAHRCGPRTTSPANGRSEPAWPAMSDRFTSNTNAVKVDDYLRWDAMVAYQQPKCGDPAQRAEPHQPPALRRADPVGPRPLGAGHRPAGAAAFTYKFL